MEKFNVAICQMNSTNNIDDNLTKILKFCKKARKLGADLICFPETCNFIPTSRHNLYSEEENGRTLTLIKDICKELNVDIQLGSILETSKENKPYNTAYYISNEGKILFKYRKLHMFDAVLTDGTSINESDLYSKGNTLGTFDTRFGKFGIGICYDIRFPEMYRKMALNGAKLIFNPSNFSMDTGSRHWDILTKARAIENNLFLVAVNEIGQKKSYASYGHSRIINPDGVVIGEIIDGEDIKVYEVNLNEVDYNRENLPNLKHVRDDVY